MPNLPHYVAPAANGGSVYTASTSATGSTVSAQDVLKQWEADNHEGDGTGTDDAATVTTGQTVNGQTTFIVTPNDSGTGTNEAGSGTSGLPAGVNPNQANQVSAQIQNGQYDKAKQSFSDMLSDSWMNSPNIDINGLVQAVMRNAYEDNQQDLKYYALKVQFYNNLKKSIRAELGRAREAQSTSEVQGSNNLSQPFQPGPTLSTNPPADGGTQVQTQAQAAAGGTQTNTNTGGGATTTTTGGTTTTTTGGTTTTTTTGGTTTTTTGGTTTTSGTTTSTGSSTTTSSTTTSGTTSTGTFGTTGQYGNGLQDVSSQAGSLGFKPGLDGDQKDWKVYKTQDGHYVAINFNQNEKGAGEMRVYQPGADGKPGALTDQVWGDPHMNTSGDTYKVPGSGGSSGFNQYGQFGVVLPDGTTISASCDAQVNGKPAISSVDIASGNDHYKVTSGDNQTGTSASQNMGDGQSYITTNVIGNSANNNLFALQDSQGGKPAEVDVYQGGTWRKVADQNNIAATAGNSSAPLQTSGNATNVTSAQSGVAQAQGNIITTSNQLDNYIQNQEDLLQSVGDDAQLAQTDLQNMAQKQQQTLQTLSNLSKSFHDLSMAIIRNISG